MTASDACGLHTLDDNDDQKLVFIIVLVNEAIVV
jgi:hypothetical protein